MVSFMRTALKARGMFIPPIITVLSIIPSSAIVFAAFVRGDPPTRSANNKISSSSPTTESVFFTFSTNTSAPIPSSSPTDRMSSLFSPESIFRAVCIPRASSPWLTKNTYFIALHLFLSLSFFLIKVYKKKTLCSSHKRH